MTENVRETIHHGEYFNDRWMEIDLTPSGVCKLLATSPYPAIRAVDDPQVLRIVEELTTTGVSELGWAEFTVVEHA